MRKLFVTITFLLSLFFLNAQTKNFIDQPYIDVTAEADSLVIPDEIFIRIIISEKDTRDRIPVEEQEKNMVAGVRAVGINTEKDLFINDMGSYYKYNLLKHKDVIKTKVYSLKVSDAATAGKVFMKLEELNISNSDVERINHSALEKIKNAVRTRAVERAKASALALTAPLNQTIGQAIYISDNISENSTNSLAGQAPGISIRGTASFNRAQIDDYPKIQFDKINVRSVVQIRFVLK